MTSYGLTPCVYTKPNERGAD